MSLLVIAVTLGVAYLWTTRGFFSALLHMACVVVAGAIAFALWEPIALALLDASPQQGFLSFLEGVAWGLGLAIPFAVSLALLRVTTDVVIRANVNTPPLANYIGGGACGLVSGLITAGILTLSIGFTRVPSDMFGYERVAYAAEGARGNLVRAKKLILPADDLTATLYANLSQGVLATPDPLAVWYPDLADVPAAMRLTSGSGKARNTLRPDDFSVQSSYIVGADGSAPLDQLMEDSWSDAPQRVAYLGGDSDTPGAGSALVGYVVRFDAGAREQTGQVLMGAGQVRLLVRDTQSGATRNLHPVAAVAQSRGDGVEYVRYRYDAEDVFLASVGGATEATMAFEFVTPPNTEPLALYMRNVRVDNDRLPEPDALTSTVQRDRAIRTGALVGVARGLADLDLDDAEASTVSVTPGNGEDTGGGAVSSGNLGDFREFRATSRISKILQKGTFSGLTLGSENVIESGEARIRIEVVGKGGVDRALQVRELATTNDTAIVQLDVGPDSRTSLLGRAVATAERLGAPALIDTNGQRYDALGFIYEDQELYHIRFTPGAPLRALSETPTLSRTRSDQKMQFIFRPSYGVQIASFVIGSRVVTEFDPPILLNPSRRR
ncbi:MAG: CvpA family protein [Planctomycetota bacterium]